MNTTIDTKEVEKFSKLAEHWWDTEGEFKILHRINPIRIDYIIDKIQQHFGIAKDDCKNQSLSIIDIGCGGGLVSSALYKLGFNNITGIDASWENIEQAKLHADANAMNINYIHTSTQGLIKSGKQYEIIICLEVVEHVAHLADFFAQLAQLLKPNGMIILSTINRTPKAYLQAIFLAEYILKWVPKQTHNYSKFLKPSELQNYITPHELLIKNLTGLVFNLANKKWELSKDISVNYFAYLRQV